MIKQKKIFTLFFTIILTSVSGQESVNQFDKDGKRNGLWTKNYHETNQKRYEGVFKHGKEVDTFKYYTLSSGKSVLSAIKVFNENNSLAEVTFLSSNKMVISEGTMNEKNFVGQWIFYHKNSKSKMIVEQYNKDGVLDGDRFVYFKNGNSAEKASYKNGKLNGESKWYTENNVLIKQSYYKEDQLHGETINYDASANITSKGNYNEDQKEGIWLYYKDGERSKEINHTTNEVISKQE